MIITLLALLLAPAEPDRRSSTTNDNYPPSALRRGEQGKTRFRLDINEKGRADNCQILESSGSPELDETTCDILIKRARFKPARDEAGRPVRGIHESTMTWQLPR